MSNQIPMRALLLVCGLTTGCAQTARVHCWQPADIAADSVRSLAVVGAADEADQRAVVLLEDQLRRGSEIELVAYPNEESRIQLASYLDDEGPGVDGLLQYGRQADVDALVIIDVEKFGIDEHSIRSWSDLWGKSDGARTAEVRVNFELIDTNTREVLARREIDRTADADEGASQDSADVLDRLLGECVDEFVAELGPRETESTIQLAEGEWYSLGGSLVRLGVRFARAGRWQQAEAAWKKALSRNAHNDAALFNLAVASAQAGDYAAAEDYAMEALRIQHTDCYADGLEQIRELRSASEEAEDQMRTAVVPAGFSDRSYSLLQ